MKIDTESVSFIKTVVKTAQLVGIDNIIIEEEGVRAIDDNQTVVLFQKENIPELSFGSIGLNRISVFTSRLALAESRDNFQMDSQDDGNGQIVSLTMKGSGVKIDYRCANPTTIRAPKQLHDTMQVRVKINPEAVMLLVKASAAMPQMSGKLEVVTLASDKDGVSFELADSTNDVFSHKFTDHAESLIDGDSTKFVHRYPLKTLISLFKENPEGHFDIGQKGILNVNINGLDIFVLPRV